MKTSNINKDRDDLKLIHYTINKLGLSYMEDEIIDIAFIGYTRALNSYKEEVGAFSTLAYHCIKNEIGHYLQLKDCDKRKANYNCISLNQTLRDSNDEYIELIKDDFDLESNITSKSIIEEIYEIAKEVLTKKQYKVFILRFIYNLTHEEIGKKLNITRSAVGSYIRTAINKLKNNKKIQGLEEDK